MRKDADTAIRGVGFEREIRPQGVSIASEFTGLAPVGPQKPPTRRCVSLAAGTPRRTGPPMDYRHKPTLRGVNFGRRYRVNIQRRLTVRPRVAARAPLIEMIDCLFTPCGAYRSAEATALEKRWRFYTRPNRATAIRPPSGKAI